MSTIAYGVMSAQRQAAEKSKSKEEKPPGFGSYVDVVAALVPAEILVLNAGLLPIVSTTKTPPGEKSVTTITDFNTLKVIFWLSIVFSIGLYVVGQLTRARKEKAKPGSTSKTARWGLSNYVRAAIPAGAYVVWTMLQKSTAFDAVAASMSESLRLTLAAFAALALGALAKLLSDAADGQSPSG